MQGYECMSSVDVPLFMWHGLAVSSTKPTLVAASGLLDREASGVSEVHVYVLDDGGDVPIFRPWRVIAPKHPSPPLWFRGSRREPMSGGLAFATTPWGAECLFIATCGVPGTGTTAGHDIPGDVLVWDRTAMDRAGNKGVADSLTRGSGCLQFPDVVAAQGPVVAVATRRVREIDLDASVHLFTWDDTTKWWTPSAVIDSGLCSPCMMRVVGGGHGLLLADFDHAIKVFRTRDGQLLRTFGEVMGPYGTAHQWWGVLPQEDERGDINTRECLLLGESEGVGWDPRRGRVARRIPYAPLATVSSACRVPGTAGELVVIRGCGTLMVLTPLPPGLLPEIGI